MARVVLENLSKIFVSATGTEVRAVQRMNLVIEDKELLLSGLQGCIELSILSPRGTSGERTEGKPIKTHLLSPPLASIRWRRGRNRGA